jgi:type I restriction-modification system DNA methylase subunit
MASKLKTPELSRSAAVTFVDKWKSYADEKQHARGFWSDFFTTLCGVDDQEEAGIEYEKRVKSTISGNQEYIDVYWKNVALIEHKSAGENLDKAELQARGYWLSLAPGYRPKTIIISDFHTFRIVDVVINKTHEFPLSKLPENIHRFEAILSGNRTKISEEEITVDQQAAKLMANLYLELESHGFEGHETSIFLVRLLFLLFGDDTGMWSKNLFLKLVMNTKDDGSDVGITFDKLFEVLNTAPERRSKNLLPEIKDFPYVNGDIFAEKISTIDFNKKMRKALVEVANYDWTTINPTIFGSLFQLIKNKEARRDLGEHYTSEENINKIVYPLFLDELQDRLAAAWDSKKELKKLRIDLAKIKIFDPACGCGNFLVVSYRHLRQLELELIVRLNNLDGALDSIQLDGSMGLSITLNQLYGIEIEEWPAQVARMALFLTDHQENLRLERITGSTPNRFPIQDSAKILNANSLQVAWNEFVDFDENLYILGNPPFAGSFLQSKEQRALGKDVWGDVRGAGLLDLVAHWYIIAAKYFMKYGGSAAFVSTNSIAQGEQPAIIWGELYKLGMKIDFAHQTFKWSNDAAGVAAVHVVIIGFSKNMQKGKRKLWVYPDIKTDPTLLEVANINAYLRAAPDVIVSSRSKTIKPSTPKMDYGSKPTDAGHLSDISPEEAAQIRASDPIAAKYLHRIIGARELIHNVERYCLWLVGADPADLRASKELARRLAAVKAMREASTDAQTKKDAIKPQEFQKIRQPKTAYLAVPLLSSEDRKYVPMAWFGPEVITNNAVSVVGGADISLFGFLQSRPFNVWNKVVSGRLKSDVRISNTITYNNFPFPEISDSLFEKVTISAQSVLDTRAKFPNNSLADLYESASMPPELAKAHNKLDADVLSAYELKADATDDEILEVLFAMYAEQRNATDS